MSVSYDRAEVQKSLREKIRRAAAKVIKIKDIFILVFSSISLLLYSLILIF